MSGWVGLAELAELGWLCGGGSFCGSWVVPDSVGVPRPVRSVSFRVIIWRGGRGGGEGAYAKLCSFFPSVMRPLLLLLCRSVEGKCGSHETLFLELQSLSHTVWK